MNNSRVNKYRELREGIKEEVGINREGVDDNFNNNDSVDEDDDFLLSVNRAFRSERKEPEPDIEDTLTEAKTFEQMQRESSEEIDRALRSAKVSVGKAAHYNTRMDILNKIREPEKQVVRLNKFDNVSTSQFSKGFFVNGDDENLIDETSDKVEKKKMTLMERLASMSPEEDAKKAKLIMEEENVFEDEEDQEVEEATEPALEQTKSLEEMLKQIKEKDQREVEKALKQKEMTTSQQIIKEETVVSDVEEKNEEVEVNKNDSSDRVATILNYIIIFLVIVFVGLCGMIGYQIFF